jgi:hypothetical protein
VSKPHSKADNSSRLKEEDSEIRRLTNFNRRTKKREQNNVIKINVNAKYKRCTTRQ